MYTYMYIYVLLRYLDVFLDYARTYWHSSPPRHVGARPLDVAPPFQLHYIAGAAMLMLLVMLMIRGEVYEEEEEDEEEEHCIIDAATRWV